MPESPKKGFKITQSITVPSDIKKIGQIKSTSSERISTTIEEFDRVLGGPSAGSGFPQGIVPGEVILLSGDPGIGKSTIMLQIALNITGKGKRVLYVSGEESESQIKIRAERIVDQKTLLKQDLLVFSSTDIDQAVDIATEKKVDLLIIDSIQTVASNDANGFPGSLPQLRYCMLKLVQFAKSSQVPVFSIGHVTKEGIVAGPMLLSHMVDCVLYLEGEQLTGTRVLRTLKNRFGDTNEVGIFIMEEKGLTEIANVKDFFLGTNEKNVPGSCITVVMEGSRPLLVEIQALVVFSKLPMPRRVASGIDYKRLELLIAVLQKHGRLPLETSDVFVNVAGGLKLSDPAVDLGICLSIYSSLKNISLSKMVAISEVGLLGELRSVGLLDKRIKEAKKLGFKNIVTSVNYKTLNEVIKSI